MCKFLKSFSIFLAFSDLNNTSTFPGPSTLWMLLLTCLLFQAKYSLDPYGPY